MSNFVQFVCLIALVSIIGWACSDSSSSSRGDGSHKTPTKIGFEVKGLEGQTARFLGYYGESYYHVDSLDFDANGKAIFSRDSAIQEGLYFLVFPDGQSFVQLLVADDWEFDLSTDVSDPMGNLKVNGSQNTQALLESILFEGDVQQRLRTVESQMRQVGEGTSEYDALAAQRAATIEERVSGVKGLIDKYKGTFFATFKESGQNPTVKDFFLPDGSPDVQKQLRTYLNEYWDNVDFSDGRLVWTPVFHNKLSRYITEMVPQNGDTLIRYSNLLTDKTLNTPDLFKYTANYIASKYRDGSIMDWEKVYSNMVMRYFTQERAFWSDSLEIERLRRQTLPMRNSALGITAPDITVNDIDGNPISLNDVKDPIVILFIYNPTCDHCLEETPELIKFYNEWHPKGVEIYAVSFNAERSEYEEYMRTFNPPWKYNVFDQNNDTGFAFRYQVDHTPEVYVINEDRKIIGKNLKVAQIPTILERNRIARLNQ